jgi:hypothetical protein
VGRIFKAKRDAGGTAVLSLAILHEEIEHEAWFSEFLGHGPSGHYSREGRPNSPYVGKFLNADQ